MHKKRTVALVLSAVLALGTLSGCSPSKNEIMESLHSEINSDMKQFYDAHKEKISINSIKNIAWKDNAIAISCEDVNMSDTELYHVYYAVSDKDYNDFISGFAENKTYSGDIPKGKLEQLLNLTERYTMAGYEKVENYTDDFNFNKFIPPTVGAIQNEK